MASQINKYIQLVHESASDAFESAMEELGDCPSSQIREYLADAEEAFSQMSELVVAPLTLEVGEHVEMLAQVVAHRTAKANELARQFGFI